MLNDFLKEYQVKSYEEQIDFDEKMFASMCYIFPLQFVTIILAKSMKFYTPFIKKNFIKSNILYGIFFILSIIAYFVRNVSVPETAIIFKGIYLLLSLFVSIIILIYICYSTFAVYKNKKTKSVKK